MATVNLTINPVNDAPSATGQTVTTAEDAATALTLAGSDVEGDSLTFVVVMPPTHGSLSGSAPNLTYIPAANFAGGDSFTFVTNDGSLDSEPATVNITVSPVNDAPSASNDLATTAGSALTINVLGNDSDADGDSLTVSSVGAPSSGSATTDGATVTYTPAPGFNGVVSFAYTISDGQGGSASALVQITVTGSSPTQITMRLISNPTSNRNVRFNGTGGIGTFFLDNPAADDGDAYLQSRTFTVSAGIYTITQVTTNSTWRIS